VRQRRSARGSSADLALAGVGAAVERGAVAVVALLAVLRLHDAVAAARAQETAGVAAIVAAEVRAVVALLAVFALHHRVAAARAPREAARRAVPVAPVVHAVVAQLVARDDSVAAHRLADRAARAE